MIMRGRSDAGPVGVLCYGRSVRNERGRGPGTSRSLWSLAEQADPALPGSVFLVTTTDTGTQTGGPAQAAGPSIVPQGPARLALIAVTIAVLAQTLRFSLPQFGHLSESAGAGGVAALVLLTHLAGFLAPVIRAV